MCPWVTAEMKFILNLSHYRDKSSCTGQKIPYDGDEPRLIQKGRTMEMNLHEAIQRMQTRIRQDGEFCKGNEEQTKLSLIVPMIKEVLNVPDSARIFRAERYMIGKEAVDYAIMSDDGSKVESVSLPIECKPYGETWSAHYDQLRRYWPECKSYVIAFASGLYLSFFTDTENTHVIDNCPGYTVNFLSMSKTDYAFLNEIRNAICNPTKVHDIVRRYALPQTIERCLDEVNPEAMAHLLGISVDNSQRAQEIVDYLRRSTNYSPSEEPFGLAPESTATESHDSDARVTDITLPVAPATQSFSAGDEILRLTTNRKDKYMAYVCINRETKRFTLLKGSLIRRQITDSLRKKEPDLAQRKQRIITNEGTTMHQNHEFPSLTSLATFITGSHNSWNNFAKNAQSMTVREYLNSIC